MKEKSPKDLAKELHDFIYESKIDDLKKLKKKLNSFINTEDFPILHKDIDGDGFLGLICDRSANKENSLVMLKAFLANDKVTENLAGLLRTQARDEGTALHRLIKKVPSKKIKRELFDSLFELYQIKEHKEFLKFEDDKGRSLLHQASYNGNEHVMEAFLANKTLKKLIDTKDKSGDTSLHLASRRGNVEAVRLLIQHGAKVHIKNGNNRTPLDLLEDKKGEKFTEIKQLLQDVQKEDQGEEREEKQSQNRPQPTQQQIEQLGNRLIRVFRHNDLNAVINDNDLNAVIKVLEEAKDNQCLQEVLLYNGNNKEVSENCKTALFHAVESEEEDSLKIVEALIEAAKEVNKKNNDFLTNFLEKEYGNQNITALGCAAYKGHVDKVVVLIKAGANINTRDSIRSTPLHWASREKYVEIVKILLKQKNVDLDAKDTDGSSILHDACYGGNLEIIQFLLEHKVDPNIKDKYGETALDVFLRENNKESNDNFEAIKALLKEAMKKQKEKEKKQEESDQKPKFSYANARQFFGYLEKLDLDNLEGESLKEVKKIIKKDLGNKVETALHVASLSRADKAVEIARFLLKNGANPSIKNSLGNTPLHVASLSRADNAVEIARFLLKNGANPSVKNSLGNTPLHLAALHGEVEIAKLLIEYGNEDILNITNDDGKTPLELLESKLSKLESGQKNVKNKLFARNNLNKADLEAVKELLEKAKGAQQNEQEHKNRSLRRSISLYSSNIPSDSEAQVLKDTADGIVSNKSLYFKGDRGNFSIYDLYMIEKLLQNGSSDPQKIAKSIDEFKESLRETLYKGPFTKAVKENNAEECAKLIALGSYSHMEKIDGELKNSIKQILDKDHIEPLLDDYVKATKGLKNNKSLRKDHITEEISDIMKERGADSRSVELDGGASITITRYDLMMLKLLGEGIGFKETATFLQKVNAPGFEAAPSQHLDKTSAVYVPGNPERLRGGG